jgi:hypothetical protein
MSHVSKQPPKAIDLRFPLHTVISTVGPSFSGKCWGKGTRMMLYDGTSKKVEDIVEGDVLMGDDSTPRIVQIGSVRRGNTGDDAAAFLLAAAGALPPALPAVKQGHRRFGPARGPADDGRFVCKYDGCVKSFPFSSGRDEHEASHAIAPKELPPPATYEISSKRGGRYTWTCNSDHILVLKFNILPRVITKHGKWVIKFWDLEQIPGDGLQINSKPVERTLATGGKTSNGREEALAFPSFDDASIFLSGIIDLWSPLHFECTVAQFASFAPTVQKHCNMYQPNLVEFHPPRVSLRDRLEDAFNRSCTDAEVNASAWLIGLWLADGSSAAPSISQIKEDYVNPQHSHTAVVEAVFEICQLMYRSQQYGDARFTKLSTSGNPVYNMYIGKSFWKVIRGYGMAENKHFPLELLTDTPMVRRRLLSGMIDGDGYLNQRSYEIAAKERVFMDGFVHLVRGLGLSAGKVCITSSTNEVTGEVYLGWRVHFSGSDIQDVVFLRLGYKRTFKRLSQSALDLLCHGFNARKIEHTDYFGFTVDGNGRFLMGDFTVTHNSTYCQRTLVPKLRAELIAKGIPEPKISYLSSDDFRRLLLDTRGTDDEQQQRHDKYDQRMLEVSSSAFELLRFTLRKLLSFPVQSHFVIVDTTGLALQYHEEMNKLVKEYHYQTACIVWDFRSSKDFFHWTYDHAITTSASASAAISIPSGTGAGDKDRPKVRTHKQRETIAAQVGGTCAARACKRAGPFPPFTPQVMLLGCSSSPDT